MVLIASPNLMLFPNRSFQLSSSPYLLSKPLPSRALSSALGIARENVNEDGRGVLLLASKVATRRTSSRGHASIWRCTKISKGKGYIGLQAFEEMHLEDFDLVELSEPDQVSIQEPQEHRFSLVWGTLRNFPIKELVGKVVLVRCDLAITFKDGKIIDEEHIQSAIPTISYLQRVGARIVLASHWNPSKTLGNEEVQLIAGSLSHYLKHQVSVARQVVGDSVKKQIENLQNGGILLLENLQLQKEETANDAEFSKKFTEKVDILVNDAFSVVHRTLASTVGVARFTSARIAGFQLEKELFYLTMAKERPKHPFVAIVGGAQLPKFIDILHILLKKCDTIIITGRMVNTFLSATACKDPNHYVQDALLAQVSNLMKVAQERKVEIIFPSDFLCIKENHVSTVFKAGSVPDGWMPVSPGRKSWESISAALQICKLALWIGPVSMNGEGRSSQTAMHLAKKFSQMTQQGCITIVGGKDACMAVRTAGVSGSITHISQGPTALLKLLKGVQLPGVAALDLEPLMVRNWEQIYENHHLPLFIDIGSGNGLFIFKMAEKFHKSKNFLGVEINAKLVDGCLARVMKLGLNNVHFVKADAASALKRIVSNYPGKVSFVSIQCPDPNFSDPHCRRRMVQRPLVETLISILCRGGKVFLQSDVKEVVMKLKSEFFRYGKHSFSLSKEHQDPSMCDSENWIRENPFGISTDWEYHVLKRGDRMYRVMLLRVGS